MLLTLIDDLLMYIIDYLDSVHIALLTRVCKYLHALIHTHRKVVLVTSNMFEAIRCNAVLSIKYATIPSIANIVSIKHCKDIAMLKALYHRYEKELTVRVIIIRQLCKLGQLIFTSNEYHTPSLIVHAIVHCKPALFHYMRDKCSKHQFEVQCTYGYAKVGNYNGFKQHDTHKYNDPKLRYYACVGGNTSIMGTIGVISSDVQQAMMGYHRNIALSRSDLIITVQNVLRRLVARDDVELISNVNINAFDTSIIPLCIKYDAIRTMTYICTHRRELVAGYIANPISKIYNVDMTLGIAELLLACTRDDKRAISIIVSSYNYRLTEILRARGLYNKRLTQYSSHSDFTM